MIIRTIQPNKEYQYSSYKDGWVFEVINDFGEYYTAKVLTGSVAHTNSVIAVHKGDCEQVQLGSYKTDDPLTMKI